MAGKRLQDNKKTYLEFLREKGRPVEGIVVLGFRFGTESGAHSFHFDLMNAKLGHTLFDRVRERAVVCILKENADTCRKIAKSLGGDEFSVGLML